MYGISAMAASGRMQYDYKQTNNVYHMTCLIIVHSQSPITTPRAWAEATEELYSLRPYLSCDSLKLPYFLFPSD